MENYDTVVSRGYNGVDYVFNKKWWWWM